MGDTSKIFRKDTEPVEDRKRLIEAWRERGRRDLPGLSRTYGTGRKKGHNWVQRFLDGRWAAPADCSHAHRDSAGRVAVETVRSVMGCVPCPYFTRFALRRRGGPVGGLLLADVDQLDWFLVQHQSQTSMSIRGPNLAMTVVRQERTEQLVLTALLASHTMKPSTYKDPQDHRPWDALDFVRSDALKSINHSPVLTVGESAVAATFVEPFPVVPTRSDCFPVKGSICRPVAGVGPMPPRVRPCRNTPPLDPPVRRTLATWLSGLLTSALRRYATISSCSPRIPIWTDSRPLSVAAIFQF